MSYDHRKKVLFLITKSTWGGAQQYVYDLAVHLDPERYNTVVAVGGDGPLVDALNKAGIKVISISSLKRDISFLSDIQSTFNLIKIIYKQRPDILHLNSTKVSVLGSILGRILRIKKVVFTSHGWAFNEDRPKLQKVLIKILYWITIFCTHKTIVVSSGTKTQMNWPFIQNKMNVVHLGRTTPEIKPKEDARGIIETKVIDNSASLSDFHDDIWIGTIAELHPIKRLNRAIDSVSSLIKNNPRLRFVIMHDGQLKETLLQQVKDLGLEEHIFFTGTVPNAARLLSAFDIFVLPSKSEAFGYVLIEAGNASLPVVATNVGGVPDIITHNENGLLVEADNTPELTAAIRSLLEDEELRRRIGAAHLQKAKEFSLEKMLHETAVVYKN